MKKQKQEGAIPDNIKWLAVAVLAVAGVIANVYYIEESLLFRTLGVVGTTVVAGAFAMSTEQGAAVWELMRGARMEIRRVVWPTHQEAIQTTFLVMVFVMIAAVLLWLLDTMFGWLASLVIG